jgi:hypothetical protein
MWQDVISPSVSGENSIFTQFSGMNNNDENHNARRPSLAL